MEPPSPSGTSRSAGMGDWSLDRQKRPDHGYDNPKTMKGIANDQFPTKAVIVTGASCGIGCAVALRLARDGFAVVVNYAGNAARAEGGVNEIMGQVLRANVGYA